MSPRPLYDLLLTCFNAHQLHLFLDLALAGREERAKVFADIPSPDAAPSIVVAAAVDALLRRNLVDDAFFQVLLQERPSWYRQIVETSRAYGARVERLPPSESGVSTFGPVRGGAPARVFIAYAAADTDAHARLARELGGLVQQQLVEVWHDQAIAAGTPWRPVTGIALENAEIAILLVSEAFVNEPFVSESLLPAVIEQTRRGMLAVVPIRLEPCRKRASMFGPLKELVFERGPLSASTRPDADWANTRQRVAVLAAAMRPGRISARIRRGFPDTWTAFRRTQAWWQRLFGATGLESPATVRAFWAALELIVCAFLPVGAVSLVVAAVGAIASRQVAPDCALPMALAGGMALVPVPFAALVVGVLARLLLDRTSGAALAFAVSLALGVFASGIPGIFWVWDTVWDHAPPTPGLAVFIGLTTGLVLLAGRAVVTMPGHASPARSRNAERAWVAGGLAVACGLGGGVAGWSAALGVTCLAVGFGVWLLGTQLVAAPDGEP